MSDTEHIDIPDEAPSTSSAEPLRTGTRKLKQTEMRWSRIKQGRDSLEDHMMQVSDSYHRLDRFLSLSGKECELYGKFEEVEREHHLLTKQICY